MRSKTAKGLVLSLVAAAATFFGATQAHASVATPQAAFAGEDSLGQILGHQYGGVFSANGSNFTNGSVTATRVSDSNDSIWNTHFISANVVAKFAGYAQSFGVLTGSGDGTAFTSLFDVTGWGYNVIGQATGLALNGSYRLARGGDGNLMSSDSTENVDKADHMITYKINGLHDHTNTYMVFFEDSHDFDYNDLSVQLKTAAIQGPPRGGDNCHAVPLPAAAWMGLSTLMGTGAVGGARRLRRKMA